MTTSESLFERARRVIPGGVNSPVRAHGAVGGTPSFIRSAAGARITTADGDELIDLVGSWGPMILGHAAPEIVDAVVRAAALGTSFGAPTEAEIELAELIVERVPSVEKVRLVSSGTEATMSAIRLARGHTGRERIVKFAGCYHGHGDSFLIQAGSGALTFGAPSSPGVPACLAALTSPARFNDLESVRAIFAAHPGEIAALIVEPVAGNMGTVPPAPGFLEGLREITAADGALLILDEVMTGFRVAPGGAQDLYGITPDLSTFGKIVGGGLPLGAFGGRADIFASLAPEGPVYQGGTLSGNPLATAAGIASLRALARPGLYDLLEAKSERLAAGLEAAIQSTRTTACLQRVGSMMTLFFNPCEVTSLDSLAQVDTKRYARFFHAMRERGVALPPSQYEAFFVSLAHDEATIDAVVSAAYEALSASA